MKQRNSTTFESEIEHGKYIIGGDDENVFEPRAKVSKWDDECFFDISLFREHSKGQNRQPVIENSGKGEPQRAKWSDDFYEVRLYEKQPETYEWQYTDSTGTHTVTQTMYKKGALEYEVVLKSKPKSNILRLPIVTKGLTFYYQPPLHPEHPNWLGDENGVARDFRPPHIVGSYAAYNSRMKKPLYSSKKEAEKYKTGKAFHIYRPYIIDSSGKGIYADLNIDTDNNELQVIIDTEFLENAQYPVTVDPSILGKDDSGSSTTDLASGTQATFEQMVGSAYDLPDNADISEIAFYKEGDNTDFKMCIYKKDGAGSNSHTLEHVVENTNYYGADAWVTSTTSTIIGAGTYILTAIGYSDGFSGSYSGARITYDTFGHDEPYFKDGDAEYQNIPSTWNRSQDGTGRGYSIYATYTVAVGSVLYSSNGVIQSSNGVLSTL